METKEAIEAVIEEEGLENAVTWIAGVVDEKHRRIKQLEAALRHARDFSAWMSFWPNSTPSGPNINMYDAALEGKKDE